MTDREIIELFFKRDETALKETEKKYGSYCRTVSKRILNNSSDAEECVNDALLAAWQNIPPDRPDDLGAFLCRITRNISAARLRYMTAEKRGGGEADIVIGELEECLAGSRSAEDEYLSKEFTAALDRFYKTLSRRERDIFLCRYYYSCSVEEIAEAFGRDGGYIRSMLSRTRKKLANYLKKEDLI